MLHIWAMITGLANIAAQCIAHGRISAIYLLDVDAVMPSHWLSGYNDGDISGATAVTVTPTQSTAEYSCREDASDPGRAHRAELKFKVSKGQSDIDELLARLLHASRVHVIFTDSAGLTRIMEYARGRAVKMIGQHLGDWQGYEFTFTTTDSTPPRIYAGTIPV